MRYYAPGVRYYDVVVKCVGDEMLLRPDAQTCIVIALALAAATGRFSAVRLLAFCFVSNHFHLVLRVDTDEDAMNVSAFMKALDEVIAMRLNDLRGRRGHFFAGKPSITPILDEAHVLAKMLYAHAQPVHHGLVARVEQWLGLSSFRAVVEGKSSVELAIFDEKKWREAGARKAEREAFTTTVSIPLARPIAWDRLSTPNVRAARRAHEASVREREREKEAERKSEGLTAPPKGAHYETIDPFSRPVKPSKRTPKPVAHGDAEAVAKYREAYCLVRAAHRRASAQFRRTGVLCPFPAGTFPPWIERAMVTT